MLNRKLLLLGASLLFAATLLVRGVVASDTADVYYGRGVQAFYDEDWRRAESYFDRAVTYAPSRPHAYYFRGIARHRLGRPIEADQDLHQGAMLEAGRGRSYEVGMALLRLGGQDRRLLDQVRVEMLSGVPSRRESQGMPGALDRQHQALRPVFSLTVANMASLSSPSDLVDLIAKSRGPRPTDDVSLAESTPKTPVTVDIPESARGSMRPDALGGLMVKTLGSFFSWAPDLARSQSFGAPGMGGPFGGAEGMQENPFGSPDGGSGFDEGMESFDNDDDPFGDGFDNGGFDSGGFENDGFEESGMSGPASDDEDPFADDPFN